MKLSKKYGVLLMSALLVAASGTPSRADDRIFEKSVAQLQQELSDGTLTSEQLVKYYLQRIKVYDGAINSMITLNPKVLDEARRLDKCYAAN